VEQRIKPVTVYHQVIHTFIIMHIVLLLLFFMFVCSVFAVYTAMMYQAKEVLCFKVYTINMFVVYIFSST